MALPCLGKSVFESRKVVKISSQPGNRNCGKNGGKILFQNETRAPRTHEKMSAKSFCPESGTTKMKRHQRMNRNAISSRKLDKKMADEWDIEPVEE
jgi:hypothetical protein